MSDFPAYAHTVWCDDIRQEVGNKASLIGVYQDSIIFSALPAAMPQLCAMVLISVPAEPAPKDVSLRVSMDNDRELLNVPSFAPPPTPTSLPNGEAASRMLLQFILRMAPLQLPEGVKFLQVQTSLNGKALGVSKLHVNVDPKLAQPTDGMPV